MGMGVVNAHECNFHLLTDLQQGQFNNKGPDWTDPAMELTGRAKVAGKRSDSSLRLLGLKLIMLMKKGISHFKNKK